MTVLAQEFARARGEAIRLLLAQPLIDQTQDPETFRLIANHRGWLIDWFDQTCGWRLTIDARGGMARLFKRSSNPDPTRPAVRPRRTKAARRPLDRRRYELLCLVSADLSRRPATTIALLAAELESVTTAEATLTTFEPHSRMSERRALVDVLNILQNWGVLTAGGGTVADYIDDATSNAIIEVDQSRLHHLLASATAPSSLRRESTVDAMTAREMVGALANEPRYRGARDDGRAESQRPDGHVPDDLLGDDHRSEQDHEQAGDEEHRNRWRRHSIARRLLDDPVVPLGELTAGQRAYLTSQGGRQWLRTKVTEAGFVLEQRAEGWAAIDPDAIATDRVFPAPGDNAKQAALLLIDHLLEGDDPDDRRLVDRTVEELEAHMLVLLARHTGWAKTARDDDGHRHLVAEAVTLLAELGMVRRDGDRVLPQPMLARYRTMPPRTTAASVSVLALPL